MTLMQKFLGAAATLALTSGAALADPAIIFDLGGVLIDWDPRHLYRKLIPDEERMEYFLANQQNA